MEKIRFPDYSLQKQYKNGRIYGFDIVRKKFVLLTPEEEVRQRLVHFLIQEKGVPRGLISLEKTIRVLGLTRRYDLVVHDRKGNPLLIAECKAPGIVPDQSVFDQVARYNTTCRVPYVLVTNGVVLYLCVVDFSDKSWRYLTEFPSYQEMTCSG